jgi:CRISPR/Cas system-associated exonuclease Cas4 (RecB family)
VTNTVDVWVSPTILERYVDCKLQAHFSLDIEMKKLQRPGTSAAVGMVAHKTIEFLQKGYEFNGSWNYACDQITSVMSEAWAPAIPPPPGRWDGYQLTKARIQLRFEAGEFGGVTRTHFDHEKPPGLSNRRIVEPRDQGQALGPFPWIEKVLFDPQLKLKGIPDLVKEVDGEIVVVDLKTGINQDEPTEKQIRQLLFYAWLVQHNTGRLPTKGEVVTANNRVFSISVSQKNVDEVIELSKQASLELNQNSSEITLSNAVTPSEASCFRCSFKVACPPFLSSVEEDWRSDLVVRGHVVEVDGNEPISYVELDIDFPKWKLGRFRVVSQNLPNDLQIGELISFSGLRIDRMSGRASWSTLFHKW